MSKFTKIRQWAKSKGYEVRDKDADGDQKKIEVIVDEEHRFECEERKSTVYMSIKGKRGNAGGLYVTHHYKPKSGGFVRPYALYKRSQNEMIESMEYDLERFNESK